MPTLVVKRLIKHGHEHEYEHSLSKLIEEAEKMKGYMGINVARPVDKKYPLYIFSAKFDTHENLHNFKMSHYRKQWLEAIHTITQKPITEHTLKGLDWWFALPTNSNDISRTKMFLLTVFGAYPIVLILNYLFNPTSEFIPMALRTLFIVSFTIWALTYITLPLLLKLLKNWLYSPLEQ